MGITAVRGELPTAGGWPRVELAALRRCSLGIELGADRTRIVREGGVVADAPSVLALEVRSGKLVAVGDAAVALEQPRATEEGVTCGAAANDGGPEVTVLRPVADGSAESPAAVGLMLRALLAKAGLRRSRWRRVAVAVPHAGSPLLMLGVRTAVEAIGAREVVPVAPTFAAACAGHLSLADNRPVLSVVCGATRTHAAVLVGDAMLDGDLVPVGGTDVHEALAQYLMDTYGLRLGPRHIRALHPHLTGAAAGAGGTVTVRGWDVRRARPRAQELDANELIGAVGVPLDLMADLVRRVVARTSAEILLDLADRGAVLAGPGAAVAGLADRIRTATMLPTYLAPDPGLAVAHGMTNLIRSDPR
ncbi:rod shape-determining protein [Streptodolium elevatio]|uniref:Rod shape-determining protein n=1 Tax=Streptodolium elevatio TaxID=3157996 RepID=A0ABV3DRI9_9ACTN